MKGTNQMKLSQISERRQSKRKKKNTPADETSETSFELTFKSDGDGDDWDQIMMKITKRF